MWYSDVSCFLIGHSILLLCFEELTGNGVGVDRQIRRASNELLLAIFPGIHDDKVNITALIVCTDTHQRSDKTSVIKLVS